MKIEGLSKPAIVNIDGMYLFGNDGKKVREQVACMHVQGAVTCPHIHIFRHY